MDEDLRRALSVTPSEGDSVSAPVRAAIQSARLRQRWMRSLLVLAVTAATGAILFFGYRLAQAVLPPVDDGTAGSLLWIPFGVAAAIVVVVASVALSAIGRRS